MQKQDIGQTIKDLAEIDFPEGLHGKILRQILFLRFRTPFLIVTTLLILNLVISGWRVWEKLLDVQAFAIFMIFWEALEWTGAGIMQFIVDSYELLPMGQLTLFFVNAFVLFYVAWYVPRAFQKTKELST